MVLQGVAYSQLAYPVPFAYPIVVLEVWRSQTVVSMAYPAAGIAYPIPFCAYPVAIFAYPVVVQCLPWLDPEAVTSMAYPVAILAYPAPFSAYPVPLWRTLHLYSVPCSHLSNQPSRTTRLVPRIPSSNVSTLYITRYILLKGSIIKW